MRIGTVKAGGAVSLVAEVSGGVIDLGARLGAKAADLQALLAANALADAARVVEGAKPDYRMDEIEFLPLNARSDARIFALGVAYKDHQLETGRSDTELPSMFIKLPNSLVGHGQPLVRPKASAVYDFEGEIVIVIGKGGRAIPEANALEHVAGYSILMDGSLRDFQKASVTAGKNFDRSSSYGPWMLTADQVPDWRKLEVTTRLNGAQVQHSAFGMLIWPIEFVIHYISTFTHLQPGDSISTGTPAGVGFRRNPPLLMKAGDELEVSVTGVGSLKHKIIDET